MRSACTNKSEDWQILVTSGSFLPLFVCYHCHLFVVLPQPKARTVPSASALEPTVLMSPFVPTVNMWWHFGKGYLGHLINFFHLWTSVPLLIFSILLYFVNLFLRRNCHILFIYFLFQVRVEKINGWESKKWNVWVEIIMRTFYRFCK